MSGPSPVVSWRHAIIDAGLPRAPLLVAMTVSAFTDSNGRRAYPGVAQIMAGTGYSRRTVQRALALLRRTGWLRAVAHARGGRGQATVYETAWPPGLDVIWRTRKGVTHDALSARKGVTHGTKRASPMTPQFVPEFVPESGAARAAKAAAPLEPQTDSPQPPITDPVAIRDLLAGARAALGR